MRRAGLTPTPMTFYEQQAKLEPFDGVFYEYNELIIQLGYVILFAPAFPLAALVSFVSCTVEQRADAYKLLIHTRRPTFAAAQGIGTWYHLMWLIGVLGTLTNVTLVGFTSTQLDAVLPFGVLGVEAGHPPHTFPSTTHPTPALPRTLPATPPPTPPRAGERRQQGLLPAGRRAPRAARAVPRLPLVRRRPAPCSMLLLLRRLLSAPPLAAAAVSCC